jgi:hypothetical protein
MNLVGTNLYEFHLILLLDIYTNFVQNFVHLIIKQYPLLIDWKYQMVNHYHYIITFMYIFVHPYILGCK